MSNKLVQEELSLIKKGKTSVKFYSSIALTKLILASYTSSPIFKPLQICSLTPSSKPYSITNYEREEDLPIKTGEAGRGGHEDSQLTVGFTTNIMGKPHTEQPPRRRLPTTF